MRKTAVPSNADANNVKMYASYLQNNSFFLQREFSRIYQDFLDREDVHETATRWNDLRETERLNQISIAKLRKLAKKFRGYFDDELSGAEAALATNDAFRRAGFALLTEIAQNNAFLDPMNY